MPERTVHAVVLRRRDAGESDRRLTLFTREAGKIDVVAKGARKGASRLAGSSDPLTASVLTLASAKRNEYVTQAQPLSSFRGLRQDYDRLSYGLALLELYDAVLPYGQPVEEAFQLLLISLAELETHPKPLIAMIWCELKLLDVSGFQPSFRYCSVTGKQLAEAEAFVSPESGGYVSRSEADAYMDRYLVRAEVLLGLAAMADLDEPPANLKFADEALIALLPFWRHIAVASLPANEACIKEIVHKNASERKT